MLTLTDINAGYGKVQVLRNLSLSVNAGEILCLLGRNGAGKTTTLKTIMGLVPVTSGAIAQALRKSMVAKGLCMRSS